jgi:hypothetical protein
MIFGRLAYFLTNPSEYIGLWTLDLTVVTLVFSAATLVVVLVQLRLMTQQMGLMTRQTTLMNHQDILMQRQTDIVVRQDETNREVLSRRARLLMYVAPSPPNQVIVCCRNDGNKTAQNFYWHCLVPVTVDGNAVWDSTGNQMLFNTSTRSQNGELYRHYNGFVTNPLYPTRIAQIARINATDQNIGLWWTTVSEDGADPSSDGKMQRMERRESKSESL